MYGIGVIQAITTHQNHHFSINLCHFSNFSFQKIFIKTGSQRYFQSKYQVALHNITQKRTTKNTLWRLKVFADAIISGSTGIGWIKLSVKTTKKSQKSQ